jgi:hypothetical protein
MSQQYNPAVERQLAHNRRRACRRHQRNRMELLPGRSLHFDQPSKAMHVSADDSGHKFVLMVEQRGGVE